MPADLTPVRLLTRRRGDDPSPAELAAAYDDPAFPTELRADLAERLALIGEPAVPPLLALVERHGPAEPLLAALAMVRSTAARDLLCGWLGDPRVDQARLLRCLAAWAEELDESVIRGALAAPGRETRLAGLHLLTFRQRRIAADALLELVRPALADPRAEVVIAALGLLRRREEPLIVGAIAHQVGDDALPGVAAAALEALGAIASLESALALVELEGRLRSPALVIGLERQILAQFRHRRRMADRVVERHREGGIPAGRARRLLHLLAPEILTTSCREETCRP